MGEVGAVGGVRSSHVSSALSSGKFPADVELVGFQDGESLSWHVGNLEEIHSCEQSEVQKQKRHRHRPKNVIPLFCG
jgi:hypothetical protein